jgi:hypothetical protein
MRSIDPTARPCILVRPENLKYGLFKQQLFYDADQRLLNIGITSALESRWVQHRRKSTWWPMVAFVDVTQFPARQPAREAELKAIAAETPLHNIADRPSAAAC